MTQTKTLNPTNNQPNGVTKLKVTPIPDDRYRNASPNGSRSNGVVPPDAGARIPIPIRSINTMNGNGNGNPAMNARMGAMQASIPNVMAPETMPTPMAQPVVESVEDQVNRLRPKTIRLQLRFLYTLFFALWLFGRLVIWQVYVARIFPKWVNSRNTQRWRKYAKEFRNFAIRMGGVQIKAGQFASTRADILPEEVIAELADLQDKVPTIPFKRIRSVLERELGKLNKRYQFIDEEPIAAASLGQVHRAILTSGEKVVVKVQRPEVREIVYTDLAAMFIVAKVAMRFPFINRRVDAVLIVEEFGRVLLEEVSYEKERENAARFKKMFANDGGVYVPTIYAEHSTDQILTIEDVTSIKLDDYARLEAAGIRREDVADRLMETYMQQIFQDRFFHADPHPGNLFVYPLPVEDESLYIGKGGRPFYLIFIDFGMTGTLTREIVQGLINTLTSVITRDPARLVQSYQQLGFLLPGADTRRIEEATRVVFDEVWGLSMADMTNIDFAVVDNIGREFNDLLYDMPFRVPQDFVYLGRTVGILTGMATALDPSYNPWAQIQHYMRDLITSDEENNIFDEFNKIVQDSLNEIVTDGPQGFVRVAQRVFSQFQRVSRTEKMLQQIIDGEISLETRMSSQQRRQMERIEIQTKRTARMMIVGSGLVCSTLLYTNGDTSLALVGFALSGVVYMTSWFIRG